MTGITIYIGNFNEDKGVFWSYIYRMLKFAYPAATFISTIDDMLELQTKDTLLVVTKPRSIEALTPYFSDWNKVVCWTFEAINTNYQPDDILMANRQSLEKVTRDYKLCHLDEESARQLNCTWLPIGYSPILESETTSNKIDKTIFVGDWDSKNSYRYKIVNMTQAKIVCDGFGSIQQTNDKIARFEFGLHVPSTTNYLNVNWHRLMLYYANKTIPILIGPEDMQTPRLPFVRVTLKNTKLVRFMEYDKPFADKAYDEVRKNYDFKNLIDGVLNK